MIQIILNGCNGSMGRVVSQFIAETTDMTVVADIDRSPNKQTNTYPVYNHISNCKERGDLLIDFSHHSLLPGLIQYCRTTHTPLLTATSGFTEKDYRELEAASQEIPIFQSTNFSLGINLLIALTCYAAKSLDENFNIEILEKYHNKKIDAPSGTTLTIADAVKKANHEEADFIYGRHGRTEVRKNTDIGIHSIRGGTYIGEHTVIFAGMDEIIELKHVALSKNIFALGALTCSRFLVHQETGLYHMKDLLALSKQ
ncbi:4-hydroxy-tetrahydrodipicolinate reductase [Anaerosolibacter carboniphilus]|uniref:4-hydroxy-tetrahydrodipicolinate reductase n=1 Tax=Anaerosolibacter carboniphilus TaxID=1417629 RepID=A0A841KUJ8_9FIRM|nr:4-hydroxy-tetrahydrodipicolinate reductase [Anaerosolibacter carboniphilus]MBB6217067.1 4-hydroxy-tetrahydrodipicolinate reductase [Anaerosolibacter carboniphilus]